MRSRRLASLAASLRPSQACLEHLPDSFLKASHVRSPSISLPLYQSLASSNIRFTAPLVVAVCLLSHLAPTECLRSHLPTASHFLLPVAFLSLLQARPAHQVSLRQTSPVCLCRDSTRSPSRRLTASRISCWWTSSSWAGQAVMRWGWKCFAILRSRYCIYV